MGHYTLFCHSASLVLLTSLLEIDLKENDARSIRVGLASSMAFMASTTCTVCLAMCRWAPAARPN